MNTFDDTKPATSVDQNSLAHSPTRLVPPPGAGCAPEVEQVTQAIVAQPNLPLLRTFSLHDEEAVLAVKVHQFEAEELGEPYAGVVEQPEDGAVSRDRAVCKRAHFSGRRAGQARRRCLNSSGSIGWIS